jgi:cell division protease FtsH
MDQASGARSSWLGGRSFWWWLAAALLLNWTLTSVLMGPPERTEVSYTFFTEQVAEGNVESVTATGDTIVGRLRAAVDDDPPGSADPVRVESFATERPSFASDDLLGRCWPTTSR